MRRIDCDCGSCGYGFDLDWNRVWRGLLAWTFLEETKVEGSQTMNRFFVGLGLLGICGSSAMNLTFGLAVACIFLNIRNIRFFAKKFREI